MTPFLEMEVWRVVNVFMGAALGAAFYVLLRTQPFLHSRTYDPKYNSVYISRFITGVIGGVILATALQTALKDQLSGAAASLTCWQSWVVIPQKPSSKSCSGSWMCC
jgi:hypothetical protein